MPCFLGWDDVVAATTRGMPKEAVAQVAACVSVEEPLDDDGVARLLRAGVPAEAVGASDAAVAHAAEPGPRWVVAPPMLGDAAWAAIDEAPVRLDLDGGARVAGQVVALTSTRAWLGGEEVVRGDVATARFGEDWVAEAMAAEEPGDSGLNVRLPAPTRLTAWSGPLAILGVVGGVVLLGELNAVGKAPMALDWQPQTGRPGPLVD